MIDKYKLILVRHAKTEYNKYGYFTGQRDIDILKDSMVDHLFDFNGIIYSSPLKRCKQTIEKICPELTESVIIDSRLTERCMGNFENKNKFQMQKQFPEYFINGRYDIFKTIPNGESFCELYSRVFAFYSDKIVKTDNNVLICGHNQNLKILKAIFLKKEITMDYWYKNNFENGKLYVYKR